MRKSFILIAMMVAVNAWALTQKDGVYQIGTCQDMVDFADLVNKTQNYFDYPNRGANAKVTAAIKMDCTNAFPMIGSADDNKRYVGTFDGQNFPIKGLKLTANTQNVGLFAAIGEGAYIKNMIIQDVEIEGTLGNQTDYPSIGGMVGWMHKGTIEGCYVSGTVKGSGEKEAIGGVVGNAWGGTIKDCLSEVTVIGTQDQDYVGGIVGYAKGEGNDNTDATGVTISSCVFNGDVQANSDGVIIGGIVGTCDKAEFIINSYYSGEAADYGVGSGANNTIETVDTHFTKTDGDKKPVLNSEETVCKLNGGSWSNNVCSGATSDVWSSGEKISNGAGIFDENGTAYYMISFSANGGTYSQGATTWKKMERNSEITSTSITEPIRENYKFLGWATSPTATFPSNSLGIVKQATTIYAVWGAAVSFDMNNHGTQVETQGVILGGTATEPASPAKGDVVDGYAFMGWFTSDAFTQAFDFENTTVSAAIELHAKWLPAVMITVDVTSSKEYNGQVQTIGYTVTGLPNGYQLACNASSTNVTASPVNVTCDKIVNAAGTDVTDQFYLVFTDDRKTGALTIVQATENAVTVSLDDWTYGSTSVPTPDVSATFHAEGEPIIKYAKKDADTTKAESWSATIPTDAGEYYVKATVAGTDNYVGGGATAEFSITAKGTEGFVVAFEPASATYTGDNQTPTVIVKDDETTLTAGKDYTVTWSATPNAAGTYTATVTGKGDYSGTKTAEFTVGKDEVATTTVTVAGWTYGGTPSTPSASGIGAETATFEYAKKGEEPAVWSSTVPKDAGEYIVRATIAATDNYAAKTGTAEFSIDQREVQITWSDISQAYTGATLVPTATITNLVGSDACNLTLSDGVTDAGSGTVTVVGLDNPNYKLPATAPSTTFTVTKATENAVSVSLDDWTYGSTSVPTPSASATFHAEGEPAVVYAKKDADTTKAESWSATVPTDAGEYYVKATVAGTDNYVGGGATAEFSITAKSTEGFVVTFNPASATYTGNDQTPTVTVKDGETTLTAGKDYTVTWSATPNAAGTYTAIVTGKGNYSGTKTAEFTVNKNEDATTAVTISGWTYGETPSTPSASGIGAETATFEYAKKDVDTSKVGNWDTKVPTDAGDYYVKAIVAGTNNYVASSAVAEFTINPLEAEIEWGEIVLEYTGEMLVPTATVSNLLDGDVCVVEVDGGIIDAGDGSATVIGLSNKNYKIPEEIPTTSFKVIPKVEKEFVVTISPMDFTYTGLEVNPVITVKDGEEILKEGVDYSVSGIEGIVEVGEYKVTISGMGKYKDRDIVKFTISPIIVVKLADDETLVCSEGAKGAQVCNASKDNITHIYGVATAELPNATKSGWVFEGWYDNESFVDGKIDDLHVGHKVETIAADRKETLELYPKFTKKITVVYGDGNDDRIRIDIDQNDDDNEIVSKIKAAIESEGITPSKTSTETTTYSYNENWEKNDLGEYVAQFDSNARIYEVTLNVPDGAIINGNVEEYAYGVETTLPTNVTYGNWTFDGWIDDAGVFKKVIPGTTIGDVAYTAVFSEIISAVYGGEANKYLPVKILETDDDSTCIRKIKDEFVAENLVDSVKKVNGSVDSVYTYESWQKKLDDKGNPVLDAESHPIYEPTFKVEVKQDTIIAVYGDNAETDFVAVNVAVTDSEEERIAKIKQSITADIAQNIKKVHEYEDSVYIYDSWQKKMEGENPVLDGNGNVVYEPTFKSSPKVIELSVVYGINPETDVILVEVDATDSEDERIQKIKEVVENSDPKIVVEKTDGSDDSTYTYDSWKKKTDDEGKPVVDENGNFVYEPTFDVEVKTETIVAVYGGDAKKDFIEVEVAVTDSDAKRIEKIKESLEKQGITPSKAEDADSTYAYNGDWKKIKEGFQAEFESNSKYIVVVVDGDSVNVMKSKDEIDSGTGDDAVVEVKVVVDGDTSKVPVSNGDVLEDAAKEVIGENPTKPETADSTYEFIRWEPIVEDGEPVVDENGNSIYEPSFKSEVKKDTILVDAGDGKTMEVVIHVTDDDGKIQNRIIDSFEDSGTPLPKKNSEGDTLYKLDSFVLDEESGIYEPTFKKVIIFPVVFVMPKAGKLLSEFEGYVYGERTKLPEACIVDDDEWEFKGWYTEPNGLGTRVKYMLETDVGKKVFFPLFQKTVTYSINGTKGGIEVIYSKNAEKNILRSLDRVIPEDFRKKNVNFTFDKWVLENGTYVAKFFEGQGIHSNVLANVHIEVVGHVLEVTGVVSGSKVLVYDARGRLVQSAITGAGSLHMNVQNPGRYIVRVDNWTMPVNVH